MKNEPLILALETSLSNGSLAILKGNQEIALHNGDKIDARSEGLLEMISECLESNNLQLKDIELISVSVGPGSFTGIRVGVATAQALATGLDRPCIGVSILEALTAFQRNNTNVLTVVPSGREQAFWQFFLNTNNEIQSLPPQAGTFGELVQTLSLRDLKNLTIIAEASIYSKVEASFIKSNIPVALISASDNVAKYIAAYTLKNLQKLKHSTNQLTPKYILDVEIGKTGQTNVSRNK